MHPTTTLRVARPTERLDEVMRFYEVGLGLARLDAFEDHDGFDGVMLGVPGAAYHLEFTRSRTGAAADSPGPDNLLVFYIPDRTEWTMAVETMVAAGYPPVPSFNPYWDRSGRTFEDPDGCRVVLQNAWWSLSGASATEVEQLDRVGPGPARDGLMPLFLLADDSEEQVRGYYQQGDLLVLRGQDGAARGIALVIPRGHAVAELKSLAITPAMQGRGIGQRMIALVLEELRAAGVRCVTVGTASCSIPQLAFYQKAGFRLRNIDRDYFTPERGYPDDFEENGIPLRDMVWMDQEL